MADCDYVQCMVPPERHEICVAEGLGYCWGPLGHQHTPKRSHGGKACWVMLCLGHSDAIDNGMKFAGRRLKDEVNFDAPKGWKADESHVYIIRDRDTNEVVREIRL